MVSKFEAKRVGAVGLDGQLVCCNEVDRVLVTMGGVLQGQFPD